MSNFSETMEWSTRCDWDNYAAFGSKALESPKELQLGEWMIADDGEIDAESFNLSGSNGNSNNNGGSGSDGNKSSISASTDSSTKDGTIQTSDFKLTAFDDCLGNMSTKTDIIASEFSNNSPPLEASVGSVFEPLIALELGKRTFFENNADNAKSTSFSAISNSSTMSMKKLKSSPTQNVAIPRCLVEGCNFDLSMAKDYHRKHRVCDSHSKCPKVVIGGLERRFCQQCSRFHNLSEFDEKKRSCRKRLSEHNARRRKPHQETIHFNSTRLSSSLFGSGGRQQRSFLLNDTTLLQPRTCAASTWDNTFNSKFTITKGYHSLEYDGNGGKDNDGQVHISGLKSQRVIDMMHGGKADGLLVSKRPLCSKVTNPGSVSDNGCALSLLSTNSSSPWVSCGEPDRSVRMQENDINYISNNTNCNNSNNTQQQPNVMLQTLPESVQLSSSPEFWLARNQPTPPRGDQSIPANANFQLLRTVPYDQADFML